VRRRNGAVPLLASWGRGWGQDPRSDQRHDGGSEKPGRQFGPSALRGEERGVAVSWCGQRPSPALLPPTRPAKVCS
jgi:hypothetical protein